MPARRMAGKDHPGPDRARDAGIPAASRDVAAALNSLDKPVKLSVGEGYNHLEIPETRANPYGLLGRAILEQMKLAPV